MYFYSGVDTGAPTEVYPDPEEMLADQNAGFLQECAELIPSITFADQTTGRIYGRMENGVFNWTDGDMLARVIQDGDAKAGLEILTGSSPVSSAREMRSLGAGDARPLGRWGDAG